MNLIGTPSNDDVPASDMMDEIHRVNREMSQHPDPEWVNVTVGYRLSGCDTIFREEPLVQQAPEVAEILARLARHVKLAYGQMSAEVTTPHGKRRRFLTFDIADLLYVEVITEPHEPEHTDEDKRRAKLHGSARRRTSDGRITRQPDTEIDMTVFEQ
jgi:hypothetical protein